MNTMFICIYYIMHIIISGITWIILRHSRKTCSVVNINMLRTVAIFFFLASCANAQFVSPDALVEPLSPKGFRVSIPDQPGITLFAFHGKLNEELNGREGGTFSRDVTKAKNGRWTFVDKSTELKVGDVLNFWTYVDYFDGKNKLGYPNDDQTFTVTELLTDGGTCAISPTTLNGNSSLCKNAVIFEDNFLTIDNTRWIVEHYIPKTGPNYEFNSYENTPETIKILGQKLFLTPIAKSRESELRGVLDLNQGCTSTNPAECFHRHSGAYLLPPVKSGKIRSTSSFKFGRIDVRAKLPIGDWIFPDISLIPKDRSNKDLKLVIAYARGNLRMFGSDGSDLGATLLYAGPILSPEEPARTATLKSRKNLEAYGKSFHTYSLIWQPGQITTLLDNVEYGKIQTGSLNSKDIALDKTEYYVTIGVGVGGHNDFPNGCRAENYAKPWINKDRIQIKTFFDGRKYWKPTWRGDEALQIDSIKITAI